MKISLILLTKREIVIGLRGFDQGGLKTNNIHEAAIEIVWRSLL